MRFVKEPEYFLDYRINKSCLAKAKPDLKNVRKTCWDLLGESFMNYVNKSK